MDASISEVVVIQKTISCSKHAFFRSHRTKEPNRSSWMCLTATVPLAEECTASATDLEMHKSLHNSTVSPVMLRCCKARAKPGEKALAGILQCFALANTHNSKRFKGIFWYRTNDLQVLVDQEWAIAKL